MKKLLFTLLSGIVAVSLNAQSFRSVEKPTFAYRNSNTLEIEKIELTPEATLVHLQAFFTPRNWIRIASDTYIRAGADGEKQIVVSSDSLPLDTEFYMPESGTHSFTLTFPPIDPSTPKIDFIESDCENCFKIYDIELRKTKPVKSAFVKRYNDVKQCVEPFVAPVIKSAPAIYSGRLEGYAPRFLVAMKVYTHSALLEDGRLELDVPIRPDGSFSVELPVLHPTPITIRISGFPSLTCYVEPGKESVQQIDLRTLALNRSCYTELHDPKAKAVTYYGELAQVNRDLERMEPLLPKADEGFGTKPWAEKISGMSPEVYKENILNEWKTKRFIIESQKRLSARSRQILWNRAWAEALCSLMNCKFSKEYAHRIMTDNLDFNAPSGIVVELPEEFASDLLNNYPVNDETMMVSSRGVDAYQYAKSYFIEKSPLTEHLEGGRISYSPERFLVDSTTIEAIGSDRGIFFDIPRFDLFNSLISRSEFMSQEELESYRAQFNNPAFWEEAMRRKAVLDVKIAENKTKTGFTVRDVPQGETMDSVWRAILDRYKGRVVFVDIWETWCSPCRMAMKVAEPVKEMLKGRDVVYLYLASESSPAFTWQNMIPDIKGEHYRVSGDLYKYLRQKYPITGVPSYLILDRAGDQVFFETGFRGAQWMHQILLEQLEK